MGGAFGGKAVIFDYEVIAGFLSRKIGKPVKIELTRRKFLPVVEIVFGLIRLLKLELRKMELSLHNM